MTKKKNEETQEAPKRKGLFAVYEKVEEVTGNDLDSVKLVAGGNKLRVISAPVLVRKHWDLPESSELSMVPCAKFISDFDAYIEDPEAYLASLPHCPFCELEAEYGSPKKDEGFFNVSESWVMNVVQDGKVKIWEVSQKSILKALARFENDEEWAPLMPNGLIDREIIVTKTEVKNGPTKYEVGGHPTNGPLDADTLAKFQKKAFDLVALKSPPDPETEDGAAKWEEWTRKAPAPKKGEKAKSFK